MGSEASSLTRSRGRTGAASTACNSNLKGNSMFKKGNLVRLKEDGDKIMHVSEDEEAGAYVKCETITEEGLESNYLYESDELELVTEEITEQENKPQVANVPTMDVFALHDELNKYIVSIVDSLRKQGCTDRICVRIKCEHYTGDDAEITYGVEIKYGDTVNSGNLGQSAQVAWSRIQENKRLEVKAIPFYVDESP